MAVRCLACGRLSRNDTVCEWCEAAIPPAARALAAGAGEAREKEAGRESLAVVSHSPQETLNTVSQEAAISGAEQPSEAPTERGSLAAGDAESVPAREVGEPAPWPWDNDTRAILGLIVLQFALTLYLGRLSSGWSVTGFLWLAVGYGVIERLSWSLALPLVLFTLDVALLLFGIGPRQRAGFFALAPLDFFLYLLRLVIWAFIWRLQDQMD